MVFTQFVVLNIAKKISINPKKPGTFSSMDFQAIFLGEWDRRTTYQLVQDFFHQKYVAFYLLFVKLVIFFEDSIL